MSMKPNLILPAIALSLLGCGRQEHICAKDGKVIVELNKAVIVGQERTAGKGSLAALVSLDEKAYSAIPINTLSTQNGVPIEDIALGYHDRLFCGEECASEMLAKMNHTADSVRTIRAAAHYRDSLVGDSIRRGLIP